MNEALAFTNPIAIQMYRAATLKAALGLYAKCKIQANRAYTPTRMLQAATEYTGVRYTRGQHDLAASDLQEWLDEKLAARG